MSLRLRLIVSYTALILALGLAAWWGVRSLTADLTGALGETAASVGRSVFTVMRREQREEISPDEETGPPADLAGPLPAGESGTSDGEWEADLREVMVLRDRRTDEETIATVDRHAPAPHDAVRVIVNGRELTAAEMAAHRARHPDRFGVELVHRSAGGEPMLWVSGEGFDRAIPLPSTGIDAALERYTRQLGWGLLALLGAGLLLSVWLAQRVTRPLRALSAAARTVGQGTLGAQAPDGGVPEVRETIAAFNRMSAQLQRLDAEATALRADRELAELGEIGRGLAHSLRNPIHALGLSLEALAAQASDPAAAQSLAHSGHEQLQRVDQALRGFLALSAGNGANSQPVSLREVIDDVLLEASQRAQGRVHFECAGDDAQLDAVPAELRVMLHALVINALEASPVGARVQVHVARTGEAVVIDVIDAGDGVPESIRARLFQPHVSGKPHGAGMGLYLAQRLARLRYAGNISLEPCVPCGTRAQLLLHPREALHG